MSDDKPTIIYVQQSSTSSGTIAGGVFLGLILFCGFPCWFPTLLGMPAVIGDVAKSSKDLSGREDSGEARRARERHETAQAARLRGQPIPTDHAAPSPAANEPAVQPDPYAPNQPAAPASDPLNPAPSAHP